MTKTLLLLYHSNTGTTEKMAQKIADDARQAGANVVLKKVEDCPFDALTHADGLAVGSPTHYGNVSWQFKKFLDEDLMTFYGQGLSLRGKVCGCFASTGGFSDGRECLRTMEFAFGHILKMRIVPGLVCESKEVADGKLQACSEFGKKLAQEL